MPWIVESFLIAVAVCLIAAAIVGALVLLCIYAGLGWAMGVAAFCLIWLLVGSSG